MFVSPGGWQGGSADRTGSWDAVPLNVCVGGGTVSWFAMSQTSAIRRCHVKVNDPILVWWIRRSDVHVVGFEKRRSKYVRYVIKLKYDV